jgi:flagellar biogenesis protein FliO
VNPKSKLWFPLAAAVLATPLLFPASRAESNATLQSKIAATATGSPANAAPAKPENKQPETQESETQQFGTQQSARHTIGESDLARLGAVLLGLASIGSAALWVLRRAKRLPFIKRRRQSLAIVDSLNLGSHKSLTVARVYDRILVLAIAKDNVTFLKDLGESKDSPETEEAPAAATPQFATAPGFRALLQKLLAGRDTAPATRAVEVPSAPRRAPNRKITIAELEAEERERQKLSRERVEELL